MTRMVQYPENTWNEIEKSLDIGKRRFGKQINFVSDPFKREVIFRDVEHAYFLASIGLTKPATILAGGVLEELLRLFLEHKGELGGERTFAKYLEKCESLGYLKPGVHQFADSMRQFRNLVHLKQEESDRHTISKPTAISAVSSIFTVVNDLARA